MMRYYLGAILVGIFLIGVGVAGARRRAAWKSVPQDLTCSQLAAEGFGNNSHVRLTEFYLCDFAYVYEEKFTVWQKAWVPAVPRGGSVHLTAEAAVKAGVASPDLLPGKDIRVIVLLPKARGPQDIESAAKRTVLQGTISPAGRIFDHETRDMMEAKYAGLDYDNCYLLSVGVEATSEQKNAITTGVGILLAIAGGFLSLREWRKSREDEWQDVGRQR